MRVKEVYFGFVTVLILILLILASIFWMVFDIMQVSTVSVSEGKVVVNGYYHKDISLEGSEVNFKNDMVKINEEYSGVSHKKFKKGNYMVPDSKIPVYMNLMDVNGSYIEIIDSNGNIYFINRENEKETQSLYNKILLEVNN